MKRFLFNSFALMLLAYIAFSGVSCLRKELSAEAVRGQDERAITIINNTGHDIKGYQVNVAGSGAEIKKEVTGSNSVGVLIPKAFDNDPRLEVMLVDKYDVVYAREFDVPLGGNTDTPIAAEDRKSEGWIKDRLKDVEIWLNENK